MYSPTTKNILSNFHTESRPADRVAMPPLQPYFKKRLCYILVLILKDPFIGAKGGDSCGMKRAGRYTAGAKATRRIGVRPAESVRP